MEHLLSMEDLSNDEIFSLVKKQVNLNLEKLMYRNTKINL